ncbi:hypothetical protein DFA_04022 [Cavenderia fasciculata]|uniref:Uncharacterized protein n=1 Tax=Cavenderia fasciculata TaxID=261658 RepID=F4Q127_CACFS|nr:uncharacterized protein DFA_04022 [Cavenderia fasciculata]EGG18528.1 hypothetical protein DFA_04022 [Cavenderia fasciculata]|eukprot:XP_004366432.1 hypothetical protein DFA_04022 [Cavenderia fasciculata]
MEDDNNGAIMEDDDYSDEETRAKKMKGPQGLKYQYADDLRRSVNGFYDMLLMATRTLNSFC